MALLLNKGARRQQRPLPPVLFHIYTDKVVEDWLQGIKQIILTNILISNTILFAAEQVTVISTQDETN
jgi:hypothetical protein